jgi:hypothetical protein
LKSSYRPEDAAVAVLSRSAWTSPSESDGCRGRRATAWSRIDGASMPVMTVEVGSESA